MQCVGHDNCHQLVFQEIVEFVETTIRKNRHLANPLPCQKIQVIVIQGYSYFMNMQKCKESLPLIPQSGFLKKSKPLIKNPLRGLANVSNFT